MIRNEDIDFSKVEEFARVLDEGERAKTEPEGVANILSEQVVPVLGRIEKALLGGLRVEQNFGRNATTPGLVKKGENSRPAEQKATFDLPNSKAETPTGKTGATRKPVVPVLSSRVRALTGETPPTESSSVKVGVPSAQGPVEPPSSVLDLEPQKLESPKKKEIVPAEKSVPPKKGQKQPKVSAASSKDALAESKLKRESDEERKGLVASMKKALGNWNGDIFSADKGGDLTDAAGSATGGAFYSSGKELLDAARGLTDAAKDQDSLVGILKKGFEDKTGITAVKEKVSSAKERIVEKVTGKSSVSKEKETTKEVLPDGYKKDKEGRLRNEKGHFVSGPQKSLIANQNAGTGTGLTDSLADIKTVLEASDKAQEDRHEELVSTVADSGQESVFDTALGGIIEGKTGSFFSGEGRGRGGRERSSKSSKGAARGKGGRVSKGRNFGKGKFGKIASVIGGLGAGTLGFGGLLPSLFDVGSVLGGDDDYSDPVTDIASDAARSAVESKVESKVGKKAAGKAGTALAEKGALKAGGKLGSKGLLKGAASVGGKALKVLGPLAAIATAGYDAYSGWNDKDMQAEAFGLKQGQEATTGQKTSSAIANVLDMGGIVSGGLSMLGADFDTADMAKGIFDAGSNVADFFGFGDQKEAEALPAEIAKPEIPAPESAKELKTKTAQDGSEDGKKKQDDRAHQQRLEEKLERMISALEKGDAKAARNIAKQEIPPIKTEFDDTTLTLMARGAI